MNYLLRDFVQSGEVEIKTGPFGTQLKASEYVEQGTPVLNVKNLGYSTVVKNKLDRVGETTLERLNVHILHHGDIVFGRKGAVDRHAYISSDEEGWMQGSDCIRVRVKTQRINPRYLSYYFLTPTHRAFMISMCSHGTTMASLNQKILEMIEVPLPDRIVQDRIVALLESFDKKIACNEQTSDNLQQQAQTIYYEWFVASLSGQRGEFQKVSLADLMDYAGGSQPPASEFISEARKGYVRFVQIRDYESDSHVTYIPVSSKNKLCNEQDIMIARYGAALGRICFGLNGAYNVALAKVFPKQAYYREFLRCYLSSREFYEGINNKGGRSAQAGFNQSDIKSFEVYIPIDKATICAFESVAAPLFEQRLHIIKENKALGFLRDSLLPKLMTGEIDVSTISI